MVLEGLKQILIRLLGGTYTPPKIKEPPSSAETGPQEIHSVWDYLDFRENTQAYHLTSVIGFEELVDMDEIRRRIQEQFHVEYKNERSLYPYLKTLVDIGLFETLDVGGKRKWRKKAVLVRRKSAQSDDYTETTATAQATARTPLQR